jgi:tol-pal system protein YbgF
VLLAGLWTATGCVSPRDMRMLQSQLDELRAEQTRMAGQLSHLDSMAAMGEGSTRSLVVDMKHTMADMDTRLTELDARLLDLESRSATPGAPTLMTPSGGAADAPVEPAATQELYERAFESLKQEEHAAAISGFRAYLEAAPSGPEAASATFWIGESFSALRQTDSALVQYQQVIDRFPQSSKVPAALFKSGTIYEARGEKEKAYPYFRRLKEEYPQSLEYQQLRRQLEE